MFCILAQNVFQESYRCRCLESISIPESLVPILNSSRLGVESSPFVVCSAVRMADEDNRSEMNGGPESLLGGADAVKIVFHLSKVCLCCCCAAKSTDARPLSTASSLDRWSGNRPWGKTRTVFDQVSGKSVKVPEGKICLICLNVFKLLGHMAKHGSYAEYYKKVVQHLCQES